MTTTAPVTSAERDTGLFPPGSVIRRVDGESALLLGGGRALLMQLAHPLVARGVADHSDFRADPFARLQRTLQATYTIVFGTTEQAHQTAASVNAVHQRVRGDGYTAMDPELLLWVHATLVDTALRIHHRFIGSLHQADAEVYYQQSCVIAELLGCPRSDQPEDLAAFRAYVRHMVGTLEVTDEARLLAGAVLSPRVPWVLGPAFGLVRQLTVGLLPPPLRAGYGLSWDPARQAAFTAATTTARQVLSRVPGPVRRARIPLLPGR